MFKWSPQWSVPEHFSNDFLASIVVFLTALPLCMGIALASGAPIEAGLITGVVGGVLIGVLSGSSFQVSGPAAGLSILVLEVVQNHGFKSLGIILIFAGLIQMLGGVLRIGQLFRAVSPAVVNGMLSGIGVLILASQFYVMIDKPNCGGGLKNICGIPLAISHLFANAEFPYCACVGFATIVLILLWKRLAPARLKAVPPELVAIGFVTSFVCLVKLPVHCVSVPDNIFASVRLPDFVGVSHFGIAEIARNALAFALIASAETLLSANAVDRLHNGNRTRYDRELLAQGIGNTLCGFLGGLPMTGVIARSSINVRAGARSRLSAILHGLWLLLFVALVPGLIRLVPISCLAALLVLTGYKLIDIKSVKKLAEYGPRLLGIYGATLFTIICTDLLTGVAVGFVLSLIKLLYTMCRLGLTVEHEPAANRMTLSLQGAATFVSLPKLADALEKAPANCELHIRMDHLDYLDHACLELIMEWELQHKSKGGSLVIDWGELGAAFRLKSKRRLLKPVESSGSVVPISIARPLYRQLTPLTARLLAVEGERIPS